MNFPPSFWPLNLNVLFYAFKNDYVNVAYEIINSVVVPYQIFGFEGLLYYYFDYIKHQSYNMFSSIINIV